MKIELHEICKLIHSAFKDVMQPGADQIVDSQYPEPLAIKNFFAGKKWSDITLRALQQDYIGDGSACLAFMTPAAVLYYLPAYLLIAAKDYYPADMISESLICNLESAARGDNTNIMIAVNKLNAEQNEVIAQFLKFISDNFTSKHRIDEAKIALDLRWGKYFK